MRNIPEREPAAAGTETGVSFAAAMEGVRFVFSSPLIRSTMLLDFFATFFASATALLPIFAQDILQVGARGYGWLFAAPAVGRSSRASPLFLVPITFAVADRRSSGLSLDTASPPSCSASRDRSGSPSRAWRSSAQRTPSAPCSRNTIRQLETPDRLRGRMTGVNMVFFMGGPLKLGELEAGRSPTPSVRRSRSSPAASICLIAHRVGRDDHAAPASLRCRRRTASPALGGSPAPTFRRLQSLLCKTIERQPRSRLSFAGDRGPFCERGVSCEDRI